MHAELAAILGIAAGELPPVFAPSIPMPVRIGIHEDLAARYPAATPSALSGWLYRWTGTDQYRLAIIAGGMRFDLDGNAAGEIAAGEVAYEPPHRVILSWDINARWKLETDPARTSEVEVRFISESPDHTRVELEHRNLDRHGGGWEGVRDGVGGDWPLYLQRYAGLF